MTEEEIINKNMTLIKNAIVGIEKRVGATKKELAFFMGVSISSIDRNIAKGGYRIPEYIKGEGKNARVIFPLLNIAIFLSTTVKTA